MLDNGDFFASDKHSSLPYHTFYDDLKSFVRNVPVNFLAFFIVVITKPQQLAECQFPE